MYEDHVTMNKASYREHHKFRAPCLATAYVQLCIGVKSVMFFEQYVQSLKQIARYHHFREDGESWPLSVRQCGVLLEDAFRLPESIIQALQTLDSTQDKNSPPEAGPVAVEHSQNRDDQLNGILNIIINDCRSLSTVIESDLLRGECNPKESFLTILVRNAMCILHPELLIHENALIALPCHPDSSSPLLKKMQQSLRVPLLVAVEAEFQWPPHSDDDYSHDGPHENAGDDTKSGSCSDYSRRNGHSVRQDPVCGDTHRAPSEVNSVEEERTSSFSEADKDSGITHYVDGASSTHSFHDPPDVVEHTVNSTGDRHELPSWSFSDFLAECERVDEAKEELSSEEPVEDMRCFAELDTHVLTHSPSQKLPSSCSLPILCMASEDSLPVTMSSILYQRHVWRVNEPLVGVAFSEYGTSIRVCFGWVEENGVLATRLPQVHLGYYDLDNKIDLAVVTSAVSVARFLMGLDEHLDKIRNVLVETSKLVTGDVEMESIIPWRLDTTMVDENVTMGTEERVDGIVEWLQEQYKNADIIPGSMAPKSKNSNRRPLHDGPTGGETGSLPSRPSQATSASEASVAQSTENQQVSHGAASQSSALSGERRNVLLLARSSVPASEFAGNGAQTEVDIRIFDFLFDHKTCLQSTLFDDVVRVQYDELTQFVWPARWGSLDSLPRVDGHLEEYRVELWKEVKARCEQRTQTIAQIPALDDEIADILDLGFSAIFQACMLAEEKRRYKGDASEATWRHDHDRLFFDFFTTKVSSIKRDYKVHASLERDINMSKSYFLEYMKDEDGPGKRSVQTWDPIFQIGDSAMHTWAKTHGHAHPGKLFDAEYDFYQHVVNRLSKWRTLNNIERARFIERLNSYPRKCICDALGTIPIAVNISHQGLHRAFIPFAQLTPSSTSYETKRPISTLDDDPNTDQGQPSTRTGLRPRPRPQSKPQEPEARHTDIARASVRESEMLPDGGYKKSASQDGDVAGLAAKMEGMRLQANLKEDKFKLKSDDDKSKSRSNEGESKALLELPLIIFEYKKPSAGPPRGTNQHRMYSTAAARFLEAIGITKQLIFSAVGDGPKLYLGASYLKEPGDTVYILDQHIQAFDISTAIDAYHYATVLLRIALKHSQNLHKKFQDVEAQLLQQMRKQIEEPSDQSPLFWRADQQLNWVVDVRKWAKREDVKGKGKSQELTKEFTPGDKVEVRHGPDEQGADMSAPPIQGQSEPRTQRGGQGRGQSGRARGDRGTHSSASRKTR